MVKNQQFEVLKGNPEILGAYTVNGGIGFAAAIPDEAAAQLVLTDQKGDPLQTIELDRKERTGEVSAVIVKGAAPEKLCYYYVIDGVRTADPYAAEMIGDLCRVPGTSFCWDGEKAPGIPVSELMIYKLHVRGFTRKSNVSVRKKGTFRGLADKIDYIRGLGFNAVELMPVYAYDDSLDVRPFTPLGAGGTSADLKKAEPPKNYWGYAAKNYYFSPNPKYAATTQPVKEVKELVKAFHAAGIAVILEFYFPESTDPFMAMRAVRHWKTEYHIDGFHFIGTGVPTASLVKDPLLKRTFLFLERVDAGWIYGRKVPKYRNLIEYNEDFEQNARSLLKGDEGRIGTFAAQIRRNPDTHAFVNYMANVNGFTLADVVSYDHKHNEKNGEDNRDGSALNYSWNCGTEGPSRKAAVRLLRMRQLKNALLYVFLSQGIPLLMAGDECLNTQEGNNNAYSSDDPLGWMDWGRGKAAEELRRFVRTLTDFRKKHPIVRMKRELRGTDYLSLGYPDISYHDSKAWVCSFDNTARTLAVLYCGLYTQKDTLTQDDFVYVMYNAYWDAHPFALPTLPKGYVWEMALCTCPGVDDVESVQDKKLFCAGPRSVCVFLGRKKDEDAVPGLDAAAEADQTAGRKDNSAVDICAVIREEKAVASEAAPVDTDTAEFKEES